MLLKNRLIQTSSFSQNDEDDWNGFDATENSAAAKQTEFNKPQKSIVKVKSNTSVEDFSALDVKSKVPASIPKPKDDKEDDLWDMLNS